MNGLIVAGCTTEDCDGIAMHTVGKKEYCCECYENTIKSESMPEEEVTTKTKKFFVEHPLHKFSIGKISKHLKIDVLKVAIVVNKLYKEDYITSFWKLKDTTDIVEEIEKEEEEK